MSGDATVGYLECVGDDFISNVVINRNFVGLLGRLVSIVTVRTSPGALDAAVIESLGSRHVIVDLHNFGFLPFVLREQHALDVNFIVVLHSVHAWAGLLLYTLPLVRPGDLLLAPSESARRSLLRISPAVDVRVVPYCLDVRAIQEAISSSSDAEAKQDIAFMGRLVPSKGVGLLVDVVNAIRREGLDPRLGVIGPLSGGSMTDTPESPFVARLRARVEHEGLGRHVVFHGARFGPDKYRLLAASRLFVYPTSYTGETGAFSVIEAMACGLPVVATRHAGIGELIADGGNGLLVDLRHDAGREPVADEGQLTASLLRLLRGRELASKMGLQARRAAAACDYRAVLPALAGLLRRPRAVAVQAAWARLEGRAPIDMEGLFTPEMRSLCRRAGAGRESLGSAYESALTRIRSSGVDARQVAGPPEERPEGSGAGELYRHLCLS